MINGLTVFILLGSIATIVLVAIVLVRQSRGFDTAAKTVRDELKAGREEAQQAAARQREELGASLKAGNDTLVRSLESLGALQQVQLTGMTTQIKELTESSQGGMRQVRDLLDTRVKELQEGNERKLDEMRKTVDEKLHDTLEKRLGDSFKLVSDRLEAVHKGLGEMQALATGVGDLKRVLTNVKIRGTWAEVQLGAILEQVLAPGQFAKNVRPVAESTETVEYAVRLPGSQDDPAGGVWLPIDSKFPQEDYLRLQDAAERADADATRHAIEALARTVKAAAKMIHDKYLKPPDTTDFGIMFLATEGLYAEVLRQPELVEELQQRYRVVVAGPTTLVAILTSLRMGFQTLAIEQRAAQVWRILGAVRTEFDKFGGVLEKVKRQLNSASRTIEQTGVRSRAMERTLRSVEQMPDDEAARILNLPARSDEIEESIERAETETTTDMAENDADDGV